MTLSAVTTALGVLLMLGATASSIRTCTRSDRAPQRPTDLRTLSGLLVATVLACTGASLVATSSDTVPALLAFALGAAGVIAPVVLGLITGLRADRGDLA